MIEYLLPEIILISSIILIFLNRSIVRLQGISFALASFGLAASFVCLAASLFERETLYFFSNAYGIYSFGQIAKALATLSALFTVLAMRDIVAKTATRFSHELYILILFCTLGIYGLASSGNFLMLFISLEIVSIPLYLLIAAGKEQLHIEASLKYFFLGSLASAFFLLGLSFIFPTIGSLDLGDFYLHLDMPHEPLFVVGIFLISVAILFKLGAFPFYFWVPDVYMGAPTIITGFMATAIKTAGFVFLLNVFFQTQWSASRSIISIVGLVSILSMFWGNILALRQSNIKRLLAYSGISHVGYILLGVLIITSGKDFGFTTGIADIFFYLFAYLFMTLGAFAVLAKLEAESFDDIKGLGYRKPFWAAALGVFFFSLAGFPPTLGFWAKIYLFLDTYRAGFLLMLIAACFNSLIGAYYYFKVVRAMYLEKSFDSKPILCVSGFCLSVVIFLCMLATFFFGFFPAMRSLFF